MQTPAISRERAAFTGEHAESSEIWQSVLEQVPVGVVVAALPDGKVIWENARARGIAGRSTGRIVSLEAFDEFGAEHADGRRYAPEEYPLARAVLHGATVDRETMFHRSGERRVVFEVSAKRVKGPEGQDLAICTFQDVTGQHEAQQALKESAEQVKLALDAGAIVGTWTWDVREDHLIADDLFAQSFGLDPEKCRVGLNSEEAFASVHADDREEVHAATMSAIQNCSAYRQQFRVLQRDGVYRWVEGIGRVEADERGRPWKFTGVLLDIEQRRTIERQRDDALELLQTFVEAVPGVVYAKDLAGRILIGNRGMTTLTGKSPAEFIGKTDLEVLEDEAEARAHAEADRRIMEAGVGEQVEEVVHLPDGKAATWLSTKEPLRNERGEVIGLIGSSVDITARKQAEEARNLLMLEVDHRARNALAMVQSVVRLSDASDPARFRESVAGRVDAMARAQGSLSRTQWKGGLLQDVVSEELLACAGQDQFTLEGARIMLASDQVQPMNMIIHELTRNAVKHGALSSLAGRVAVRWERRGREFWLNWAETGGPPVRPPERAGFGTRLILRLATQLGGAIDLNWRADGLAAALSWRAGNPG